MTRILACWMGLVSCACNDGYSPAMERLAEQEQQTQEKRKIEKSAQEQNRIEVAKQTQEALSRRLSIPLTDVQEKWSMYVMAQGTTIGAIDNQSGMCAVFFVLDSGPTMYRMGRPPQVPDQYNYITLMNETPRFGDEVHARDDYLQMLDWREKRCGGEPAADLVLKICTEQFRGMEKCPLEILSMEKVAVTVL